MIRIYINYSSRWISVCPICGLEIIEKHDMNSQSRIERHLLTVHKADKEMFIIQFRDDKHEVTHDKQ